ncbi:MAG TPA: amidohydrolase family protein [Candidatus Limnocylindria bacterium]|nr:amidohydrolase family protein [Candidatus Limnocylindria bacterium]
MERRSVSGPDVVDLLITGGTLVDGSGAPPRPGTVASLDGRLHIAEADWRPAQAGRTIDATTMVVAPGFIDLHSHGGLVILADPRHEPKVRQGVTTEVIGVDGNGYAPFTDPADLAAFVELNAGLDGRPDIAYDWSSVASYIGRYDRGQAVNVAVVIGNSALRIGAIGWDDTGADDQSVANMRAMLREALAEGAFGISSGLDYPPGSYASTDELAALTAEAAKAGGFYHTHVRYGLGDRFLDPFREAIEIGRRGDGPVHLTHFYHRQTHPGGPEQLLALVDDAREAGMDVTFDSYPSEWASTRLLIQLPQWVQAGGPMRLKERLADDAVRGRLRAEVAARGAAYTGPAGWADIRLGAFTQPDHLRWESSTLADVMEETGNDAVDALCDLLLAENLGVAQVTSGPWSETLPHFVRHPVGMVGTDSTFLGEKPSPRTYGSFPRILGQFVRDEQLLSLEEAVRKMTGAPAARLGLTDRGLLRDGYTADLVVLDPARVRSNATYDQPRRYPDGIAYVAVNGELVVDGAAHTGALPGRALRRGRHSR